MNQSDKDAKAIIRDLPDLDESQVPPLMDTSASIDAEKAAGGGVQFHEMTDGEVPTAEGDDGKEDASLVSMIRSLQIAVDNIPERVREELS